MRTILPLALRALLVTRSDSDLVPPHGSCLGQSYYGTYGSHRVYLPEIPCLETGVDVLESGFIAEIPQDTVDLVWVEERAVEEGLKGQENDFDVFLEKVSHMTLENNVDVDSSAGQTVLANTVAAVDVIYRSPTAALIAVRGPAALKLDTLLPRFFKPIVLPRQPISLLPVPDDSVSRVRTLLSTLKFNPTVASIVNNISVPQMTNDIRFLTGEDNESGIVSRHSFSKGAIVAAQWLSDTIEQSGATCELRNFIIGFAPNVICRYPSTVNTTATVLFSAHYDSRGSFGSTRAPGADDDGSGTTAILSIARTIERKGITFRSNVELVLFAGEEQGLYGSRAYSRDLRAADANLTLMVQADMLAYHAAGEPPQLGLPDRIGTTEVTQLVANISAIYSPELKVGFTSACCSDHQSFHEQGFPATQVFERAGPIADPMYHNSGDLSEREGYDLEQVKSIAKVQFATLLHAAGFDLPDDDASRK